MLSQESGARISLPKAMKYSHSTTAEDYLVLSGTAEQVASAQEMIQACLADVEEQIFTVHAHELPALIGSGGSVVRGVEQDSGARVSSLSVLEYKA